MGPTLEQTGEGSSKDLPSKVFQKPKLMGRLDMCFSLGSECDGGSKNDFN